MRPGDTIAALATGPGRSRRAILRISGPLTMAALGRIGGLETCPTCAGAHTIRLRLPSPVGDLELPALLLLSRAPRSYTGEDSAELFIPGNPALIARAMALLLDQPADDGAPGVVRAAGPGEFTARAFLAGKLSLDQAEGVQALIAARSDEQLAAARALLAGDSGLAAIGMADQLAHALALVEAGIDFTDQEDVVPIGAAELRGRLERIGEEIRAALGPAAHEDIAGAEPVVALVGAPNAGKSTLFNALLERERVLVSDTPGTTRDAIREPLALPGGGWGVGSVALMDLAGLDEALGARSVVDSAAQRAALDAIAGADVLVFCDPSGRFEGAEPFAGIAQSGRPVIRVRTKADLPGDEVGAEALDVCALDGFNLGALRRAIADAASARVSAAGRAGTLLPRRRRALALAAEAIDRALGALRGQTDARALRDPELVAAAMRDGLDQLAELTGAISPDDIIGRVFATFCVGK